MIRFAIMLAIAAMPGLAGASEDQTAFGRFGTVTVYRQTPQPDNVVLFLSGDGGWNLGVVDMARALAENNALVAGIDIVRYFEALGKSAEKCVYPAADMEALSQFLQKKYGYRDYRTPVLVGYSSGATLAHATLVEAPAGTFRGAISLGFCPDLKLPKPMCRGDGLAWTSDPRLGMVFRPSAGNRTPWVALQGEADQVCDPKSTQAFVEKVPQGKILMLPRVGHGFSVQRNWMPQFRESFARIAVGGPTEPTAGDRAVSGLPLVEVPATGSAGDILAVLLTGDGGWAGLDRDLAAALSAKGASVVGFNALKYFWTKRTLDEAAADLARILRHYLTAWNKTRVVLIGYSFGADAMPFMASRLPTDLRDRVALVALLGLSDTASFEFHVAGWLGGGNKNTLPTPPEIQRLKGHEILCVYGTEERDSLCPRLPDGIAALLALKGDHHFGGDYTAIAEAILKRVR